MFWGQICNPKPHRQEIMTFFASFLHAIIINSYNILAKPKDCHSNPGRSKGFFKSPIFPEQFCPPPSPPPFRFLFNEKWELLFLLLLILWHHSPTWTLAFVIRLQTPPFSANLLNFLHFNFRLTSLFTVSFHLPLSLPTRLLLSAYPFNISWVNGSSFLRGKTDEP